MTTNEKFSFMSLPSTIVHFVAAVTYASTAP
jgi:hypothetical protein